MSGKQYNNMPRHAHKNGANSARLSIVNSANRKSEPNQDSFVNESATVHEPQKFALARSNSVVHTHRGDNSFINASLADQPILIDASFLQSRNKKGQHSLQD